MIIDEAHFLFAAIHHLAQSGLSAPRDVSLICQDHDWAFDWCQPKISHIIWQHEPLVARAIEWINQFSLGKHQRKAMFTEATFIEGATTGPVRYRH